MTLTVPTQPELERSLAEWLPVQRWFPAKNRTITSVAITLRERMIDDADLVAEHLLVDVELSDGTSPCLQVPVAYRKQPLDSLVSAMLPANDAAATPYDALADPAVGTRYLRALAVGETIGALHFHNTAPIDTRAHGRLLGVDQSNTSIVFGEQFLVKVFRRVDSGVNPDLELHQALTEAGCENIAPLVGWLDTTTATLAIGQQFLANASDGWSLALGSVRDLFAEADLHADEVGTDFSGEAYRLGEAVATVHSDLAGILGTSTRTISTDGMRNRLDAAAALIPEVAAVADAVAAVFDAADALAPTEVQRIHGDLHLGQALRTPSDWTLIDFEGEPVKSIDERREPDSPLRDVAGMLRSFDYAGHHPLLEASGSAQRQFRAREWVERNCAAFCDGYTSVADDDPRAHQTLLRAYEVDKAIYEAVYEMRHRPSWLPLPLRSISRLLAG